MENELSIFQRDGHLYTDSREVAKMIGKDHKNLLRDIDGYVGVMKKSRELKVELSEFFVPSTYKADGNNKTYPCYNITKKGCEFVANKLIGEKGIIFTGVYVNAFHDMEDKLTKPQLPQDYLSALKALVSSVEQNQSLKLETAEQKQLIGELKPKANYVDTILKNPGLVTITQISKDYGMSGCEMNKLLHKFGVQYSQSGQWLLYAKYQSCGYTHSDTVSITHRDGTPDVAMNTKWTQKGRLFIYQLLKENGILQVIERQQHIC